MKLHGPLLQLAELFDCVEDVVVWVKDRDGRYRWVNRAFLINYSLDGRPGRAGLDARDVIGKTDYDLSPAFLADQFRLDDEYVLAGEPDRRPDRAGRPAGRADRLERHQQDPARRRRGGGHRYGGDDPEAGRARAGDRPGLGIRAGPGLPARPLPHADHQPATGPAGAHVGPRLRAQVPRQLPPHAPEIPAQAPAADGEPGPGLHRPVAGGDRLGLRVLRSEPLHARVPPPFRPDPPRIPGALRPRGRAMPLLFQILPLSTKNPLGPCRYSAHVRSGKRYPPRHDGRATEHDTTREKGIRDEGRTLQHHLPGPLVSRRGAHAPADDRPGQGVRLRRDRDRRQAAARQPARLADGPLPRPAFAGRRRGDRDLRRRRQQRLQQPRARGPRGADLLWSAT